MGTRSHTLAILKLSTLHYCSALGSCPTAHGTTWQVDSVPCSATLQVLGGPLPHCAQRPALPAVPARVPASLSKSHWYVSFSTEGRKAVICTTRSLCIVQCKVSCLPLPEESCWNPMRKNWLAACGSLRTRIFPGLCEHKSLGSEGLQGTAGTRVFYQWGDLAKAYLWE
jgi:hypothetical protein